MEYRQLKTSIKEAREFEGLQADFAKQQATLEYVAIMADVELPETDINSEKNEEEE